MFMIGLTGGIASGKSTVSAMLQELGAVIIDADQVAKDLEAKPEPVWQEIVANFGREVLGADEEIDRKALGEKVFNNPKALALLNSIVHPRVVERYQSILKQLSQSGKTKVAVLDVPLLIEANMVGMVDQVWLVAVSREIQLERLIKRNKYTKAEAEARLNSQMPLTDKLKYAHKVIDNSGSVVETKQQVVHFWEDLMHTIALREQPEGAYDY
jgi:dephospho-CoA kinase